MMMEMEMENMIAKTNAILQKNGMTTTVSMMITEEMPSRSRLRIRTADGRLPAGP